MVTVEEIRNAQRSHGPATILAFGTATPSNCVSQADYPDYYFRITNSEHMTDLKEKFKRMCEKSMIKKRYMHLTEEFLKENPNMCEYMAPSLDVRQDVVVMEVPKLGKQAATKAIKEWGQPKSKITHLVFCTTSGVDMPGADYQLTKLLGLRPSVKRLMMYQQGCFAGGTVLRLAKDLAENNKGARVLVVCSEITAVTFRGPSDTHLDSLVGQALFMFDPETSTIEERTQVKAACENFYKNRFKTRACGDRLWRFQFLREKNFRQTITSVKIQDDEEITNEKTTNTLKRAIHYLSALQTSNGYWPAQFSGPLFPTALFVMCMYITGHLDSIFPEEYRKEILRYIYFHQNEDGGWGLNIDGHSTMFSTTLNYICMRILGEGPNGGHNNACAKARKWIHDHGSVTHIPSWGKFWLSVLGVVDWCGSNPLPPEFWILPTFSPMHPAKMWCYCRLIYMPMSYLYGKKFVGSITPLVLNLREELFTQPYDENSWKKARHKCAKEDLYYPHPWIQDLIWDSLYLFVEPLLTRWPLNKLIREKALQVTMKHIHYENENSRYLDMACVEKSLCMLACWVEDPNGDAFKKHLARIPDYFWVSEDGMIVQPVIGSQSWDIGFIVQALLATDLIEEFGPTLAKAHDFIKKSQLTDNPLGDFKSMYRHISKGAWTFSHKDDGWQVSDCTAECLKCCLLLSLMPQEIVGEKMEPEKLYDSVDFILSLQSKNGGIPAWEPTISQKWLERLNPTEFYADLIIGIDYVECTGSAIQSLVLFKSLYPEYRKKEIENFINKAVQFLEDEQSTDGSWSGKWGVYSTYSSWFALRGLAAAGKTYTNCVTIRKAVKFLLSIQTEDGGWGESYLSGAKNVCN